MKKLLSFIFMLTAGISFSDAQVLFEEDFQSGSFSGFTLTDVDGLPVSWDVSEFTDAWIVQPNVLDSSDFTAQSTSSYNPAGTSDDWMSTPAITLGAAGNLLSWEALSYFLNSDGYQVWVNSTGPTPADMVSGTSVFFIPSEENVNTIRWANLDAFANQTVYIGFRNNSTDKHILLIDDLKVEITPIIDAEMVAITNIPYLPTSSSSINFDVKNTGITPITAFTAEWTDGTNTYQETFPTNISPLHSASFTFNDLLAVNPGIQYPITATITSVNGAGLDENQGNDVAATTLSGMTFIPEKLVVGGEATGTWCGWCPRGWDYMDYMDVNYSDYWIGIAVHNLDPMADVTYDSGMNATVSGYPSGHVDRAPMNIDPSDFEAAFFNRSAHIPPAGINLTASQVGNTVELTVTAEFAATLQVDYRLNCVVIENEIQDNSYDQVNNYHQNIDPLAGYGYDWGSVPNPVPGSDLIYQHVARAILGGWDGEAGSVPTSVTSGQQVTYTWTYPIPAGSDVNNMVFVGMLIDQTTGEILNAGRNNVSNDLGLPMEATDYNVQVYPNPFTSIANIALELPESADVTVEVRSMNSQKVQTNNYGSLNGETTLKLDASSLESGIYFVDVIVNRLKITKKVTLIK